MRGALVVTASALLLGGCGSGSKGLSLPDYAGRADTVCRTYDRQIRALGTPQPGTAALARFARRTLAILEPTIGKVRAIPLPRERAALARRWLGSLDRLRSDVIAIRDAAQANDLARIRQLANASQRDNDRTNALALRLGMTACSAG